MPRHEGTRSTTPLVTKNGNAKNNNGRNVEIARQSNHAAKGLPSQVVGRENESLSQMIEMDIEDEDDSSAEGMKVKKGKHETKATGKPKVHKAKRGSYADRWKVRVQECHDFFRTHGHCKIPTAYAENKALGIWVQETRRNYKLAMSGKKPRVTLLQDQIDELDAIQFHWGFTPDPNMCAETDDSWALNWEALKSYHEEHGSFDVPLEGSTAKLGKWVRVQRSQNKRRAQKLKCFISKDRINKLTKIGFNWEGEHKI